jgi:putative ABC transport system permease protein
MMPIDRWLSILRLRWRSWRRRAELEQELHEELLDHLERQIAAHREAGLSPSAARTAALRQMRGLELRKEECRDTWQVRAIEQLLQDLRYGARTLRRAPAFTAVAVLSLALGIGANTALLGLLDAVMLKRLPVPQPDRLFLLDWSAPGFPSRYVDDLEGDAPTAADGGIHGLIFSSADFERLRLRNTVFTTTFAFASNDVHANLGLPGRAQDGLVQAVSGNFFQGVGIRPLLGRLLVPSDDAPASAPAAVVSAGFWQRHLGGDPNAAGRTLILNGTPVTITGVAPLEFYGLRPGTVPDLWVPLAFYAEQELRHTKEDLRNPRVWWLTVVGRLRPDKRPSDALAQLRVLYTQGLTPGSAPATTAGEPPPALGIVSAARGLEDLRDRFSTPLLLLMGMVGLVLFIVCANIAGLLLTKASARQPEIAIRLSLGARRLRIIRQLLTESVLLALLGGAASLIVAAWLSSALTALLASATTPIVVTSRLDARVLLFTAAVAIGSGLLFGLAPALRASRLESRAAALGSPRATRRSGAAAGKLLVASQVALSLVLLVGAGLFARSLDHLLTLDLGFDQRQLVVFRVQPGLNGYVGERLVGYYQELERRISQLPGVRSVGASLLGPVAAGSSTGTAEIAGVTPPGKQRAFFRHRVDPGYFTVLGMRAVEGRLLGPQDVKGAPRVAVVNERLVKDFLHGANPIGRVFQMGKKDQAEIVGVVRDTRAGQIRKEPPPTAYLSYLQLAEIPFFMSYEVRCAGDPRALLEAIERTALAIDPEVPVSELRTEAEVIEEALFLERAFAFLSGGFGSLALVLACVGLYGTLGYAVSRRAHEIGVRMALGAARTRIMAAVLGETLLLALGGLTVGIPAAWVGSRLLSSQLYGLSAHDPLTLTLASFGLVVAILLAGWIPARQASSVDPVVALRAE